MGGRQRPSYPTNQRQLLVKFERELQGGDVSTEFEDNRG